MFVLQKIRINVIVACTVMLFIRSRSKDKSFLITPAPFFHNYKPSYLVFVNFVNFLQKEAELKKKSF